MTPPSSPAPRAPLDARKCEKVVWQGFHNYPCGKTAKAERNGKWYCGRHDPEKVAARRAKAEAKWKHQTDILRAQQRVISVRNDAADLVERGNPTPDELERARDAILDARAHLESLRRRSPEAP